VEYYSYFCQNKLNIMENEIITELLEIIEQQEKLIRELNFRISNLVELNELIKKYSELTERQLEIEKQKLPTIIYN
jgi:hypothetical protein